MSISFCWDTIDEQLPLLARSERVNEAEGPL